MAPVSITREEVLEELARAFSGDAPEDARTARELREAWRMSEVAVNNALDYFQRAGRLVVHRVKRARRDGIVQFVPAYTIKSKRK